MVVFCIVGTEEETGGDGAGEVSAGVESDCVLRRRRAVVTRRLVPLAGVTQHCLPAADSSQTRSRQLLEKAFDEGILCFRWVLLLVCSMFVTHFSCFRSVPWGSFIFLHSGHGISASVSLSLCGWGGEEPAPGSFDDQFVLRNCSVWLHNSLVSPCVILLSELDEVLGKLSQGPSVAQQQQQRVLDTTDTSEEDTDIEQPRRRVRSRRTFKMKKGYAVGELAQFFVTGPTDAANKLSEFYCRWVFSLTEDTRSSGTFRDTVILLATNGFAPRHLAGGCWTSTATHSLKTSLRDSERRLCLLPL